MTTRTLIQPSSELKTEMHTAFSDANNEEEPVRKQISVSCKERLILR